MFNSCTFNTVKYNSTCVREVIPPIVEPSGGGARLRQRKHKVLQKQFFDIIGTKLIFNKELFNLIGIVLLARKYNFPINAQVLYQIQQDFLINGKKQIPFSLEEELIGFKKFFTSEQFDVQSFKLFLSKQGYELHGIKLSNAVFYKALEGKKQIFSEQKNLIYGEKDIRNILEALDLLDIEE